MTSYRWASPRKASEYYLDPVDKTPADLWQAVHDGHVRVAIMDVEFGGDQVRALLKLLHFNQPEADRQLELPIWMNVNVDDIERVLCGADRPAKRKGRPKRMSAHAQRDYDLAVSVAKLLSGGEATSVRQAADKLIAAGLVRGASLEAQHKAVERAYSRHFRKH